MVRRIFRRRCCCCSSSGVYSYWIDRRPNYSNMLLFIDSNRHLKTIFNRNCKNKTNKKKHYTFKWHRRFLFFVDGLNSTNEQTTQKTLQKQPQQQQQHNYRAKYSLNIDELPPFRLLLYYLLLLLAARFRISTEYFVVVVLPKIKIKINKYLTTTTTTTEFRYRFYA